MSHILNSKKIFASRVCISLFIVCCTALASFAQQVKVAVFNADVTPPIGSPVAYATTRSIMNPLSARGIVLLTDDKPIVLCAVDWIGIANEGLGIWQKKLAEAANTTVDRVSVHALHQHDGVHCDFTMARIMKDYGIVNTPFDTLFQLRAIQGVADAVSSAITHAEPVTDIGFGEAKVEKVASNRRILGDDGKVKIIRWSSTKDSAAIAAPEGVIDPWLKCVSLWNNDKPVAILTYYATHPQSYYGQGDVTCEFIGIARNTREKESGIPHIHFDGAGGNVTAGKYNDGSEAMRPVLAKRVETGMEQAWQATVKTPLAANDITWKSLAVSLPLSKKLIPQKMRDTLSSKTSSKPDRLASAEKLAWYERSIAGQEVKVSSLKLGKIWLLNMPGELFVEYQLAAQEMRPNDHICMAAYEEYGPGYIGTKIAYTQGGYETQELVSGVSPKVEKVLLRAMKKVLK